MRTSARFIGLAALVLAIAGTASASDDVEVEVLHAATAANEVAVDGVAVDGARVSGRIVNRTPLEVRDVRLLVRYVFLWNDEFNPGSDGPGFAAIVPVDDRIPPGGAVPFSYVPPDPLPERGDGTFKPMVDVMGFTQIEPATPPAVGTNP